MTSALNRRHVLGGVAATVVGLPVLSGCGGSDVTATDPTVRKSGVAVAATTDVPVGGCAVFPEQKMVLTQPSEGEFKDFSSVCTHKSCTVSASTDGYIPCMCHGSQFSLTDGSVLEGPATAPLPEVPIAVEGDEITIV